MITTGREKIAEAIVAQAQPKLEQFGIELVDVKLKRINYVEQVRESVYARMTAERKQIAEKFRSEGQGEARKILGEKERDLKAITSEAYRTAQEIKGKADAEATRLYAEAFGRDPDFYSFSKTLETYSRSHGQKQLAGAFHRHRVLQILEGLPQVAGSCSLKDGSSGFRPGRRPGLHSIKKRHRCRPKGATVPFWLPAEDNDSRREDRSPSPVAFGPPTNRVE